jgi:hypothetical protein
MLEYAIIVSLSWIWLISDIWLSETPVASWESDLQISFSYCGPKSLCLGSCVV